MRGQALNPSYVNLPANAATNVYCCELRNIPRTIDVQYTDFYSDAKYIQCNMHPGKTSQRYHDLIIYIS